MTMREAVDAFTDVYEWCDESHCSPCHALRVLSDEADRLDAKLAAAKARNDKLSRALGTTCWQCEKCGEVRDSRPCVYCELAALKAAKAEAAAKWPSLRKAIMDVYPTIPAGWQDAADWFSRYFGRE